jgi:hypothetical protein
MNGDRHDIYSPLQEFHWSGDDIQLAPNLCIRRFRTPPDLSAFHAQLTKDEWNRAFNVSHWLTIDWDGATQPSPAEIANLVLLSLWLVKSTKSHIAFRFETERSDTGAQTKRFRLLDRFAWVSGTTPTEFTDEDLRSASAFYAALVAMCSARGRLNDALLLTIAGCWSHAWQVALICHAAAAEAILTHSSGPRITRRLAKSYACVSETTKSSRDSAFGSSWTCTPPDLTSSTVGRTTSSSLTAYPLWCGGKMYFGDSGAA